MPSVSLSDADFNLILQTSLKGDYGQDSIIHFYIERIWGIFSQYLPMILSNCMYWHQSKPTSLQNTGTGVVP